MRAVQNYRRCANLMKMGRIDEPIIATAVAVDSPSAPFATAQAFAVDAAIEAQQQHSQINETAIKELLSSHSWPQGLQDTFIRNANNIAMRYIICDDSGSMAGMLASQRELKRVSLKIHLGD